MTVAPGIPVLERRIETRDGVIRVRLLGRGTPVLCLHGVSAHGRSWLGVAERLADRARFIVPDLLGRGDSTPRPDLAYRLEDEIRRVAGLVEALEAEGLLDLPGVPPVLAGHSQGAAIAIALAARESSVRALFLSNPVTPWTRRPAVLGLLGTGLMRRVAAGMFSPLRRPLARAILRRAGGSLYRPPPELIEAYAAPYAARERAETLMRLLSDWRPAELADRLPDRRLTVRVMAGDLDPRIDADSAERLAKVLGGAFRRFEDGGHVLPEQHPEALADELRLVLEAF